MGKKNEFVFNIGFNPDLPDHVKVAGILNKLGHTKASYLAKAVLFYEEHGEAVFGSAASVDYEQLKQMVRQILAEQREESKEKSISQPQVDKYKVVKEKEYSVQEIGEDDMVGILQALNGFRK